MKANSEGFAAAPRKRRRKHPGVVLAKPNVAKRMGWRARYTDPDSGRALYVSLPPELTTTEQRELWAVQKAKELAKRRMELEGGALPITSASLSEAIEGYYRAAEHLRPRTLELYRAATTAFLEWARNRDISKSADVKATRRKKAYVTGGKRGERTAGTRKLSPLTINWNLRAVKTVLNHLRLRGLVPLSSDQIADALKAASVPREAPEFLRPHECQRLLEAALRHDGDTFAATREEHAGLRPAGTTPKYQPIAPFVVAVLLTGMRLSEALSLRWASIDLNATNTDGRVVGEIRLRASETKTSIARVISLDVCPGLRALLATMKLQAGDATYVFGPAGPMAKTLAEAARRRLIGAYGAPKQFNWQLLRSTCATYQCNAPSLFGAAAAFVSAKRLGHSITVSEKHYAGLFSVSREARTLEAAMQIEVPVTRVVEQHGSLAGRRPTGKVVQSPKRKGAARVAS